MNEVERAKSIVKRFATQYGFSADLTEHDYKRVITRMETERKITTEQAGTLVRLLGLTKPVQEPSAPPAPVVNGFDVSKLIPQKRPDFVPFGVYNPLKTILKSKQFFPVYISGPSGVGKDLTIDQVASALNKPVIHVSVTEETTREDLICCKTLVDGNIVIKDGPVTLAARKGIAVVLDEIDLGTPKLMCLQSILNGDNIFLPERNEVVIPQPGFQIIATGNTKGFGESSVYVGTQAMNEALLERFRIMLVADFPTPTTVRKIIDAKYKTLGIDDVPSDQFADVLTRFLVHVFESFNKGILDCYISIRRLSYIIEAYAIFKDRIKALSYTLSRFPKDKADALLSFYVKIDAGVDVQLKDILNSSTYDTLVLDEDENVD